MTAFLYCKYNYLNMKHLYVMLLVSWTDNDVQRQDIRNFFKLISATPEGY